MRKVILLIALLISGFTLAAQTDCDCKAELDFVYEQMKKSASFKSQIKGEKLAEFEESYKQIKARLSAPIAVIKCFTIVNKLTSFVKDKHFLFYGARPDFGWKEVQDSAFVAAYRKSEAFINHPSLANDLNLDALREELAAKPLESVEGIYNISSFMKLGVFKVSSEKLGSAYYGIMLESKLGIWEPGQIMLYMEETDQPNEFDITAYGQVQKNLMFYKSQVYQFGHLFSNVVKEGMENPYSRIDRKNTKAFELSSINEDVQYFWLDDMSRYEKEEQRDALVAQINAELNAPNLIVDLRDNGGGSSKISIPILRAIKKKSNTKVYILTNFYSGSNAEQTTVRMKKIKGAVHLGQRTNGTIAYGRNYGHAYTSPSGLFTVSPTDMKFNHFLQYEEVGVTPDILLDNESDWIEQTLNIINSQNQ